MPNSYEDRSVSAKTRLSNHALFVRFMELSMRIRLLDPATFADQKFIGRLLTERTALSIKLTSIIDALPIDQCRDVFDENRSFNAWFIANGSEIEEAVLLLFNPQN